MDIKNKLQQIIKIFSENIIEKENVIKLCLLGLFSGENIFLLGKPGIAKSMIARQVCNLINDGKYFEYLMNSFSTPEELFGPISLKKLDLDIYERKIDDYLPNSDIVFLDEIWKASPAIQNTLLNIINEKIFINGSQKINVPLKLLVSASNELPMQNEGLEALYDRFLIRVIVNSVNDDQNFINMLSRNKKENIYFENELKFSIDELDEIKKGIENVKVSKNYLEFILNLKKELINQFENSDFYVSDRRWKKIVWVLKTLAFVSNRNELSPLDLLIIPHLIWSKIEEREKINQVFKIIYDKHAISFFDISVDKILNKVDFFQNELKLKSISKNNINKKYDDISFNKKGIFLEFKSIDIKNEKKYLIPVNIKKDGLSIKYFPYGNDVVEFSAYSNNSINTSNGIELNYYEFENNQWVKKRYNSSLFKMIDKIDVYNFLGISVKPNETTLRTMDSNLLNDLKIQVELTKKELEIINVKKEQLINTSQILESILIPDLNYEINKLKNIISSNFNKANLSINRILEEIDQISINNEILNSNEKINY